MVVYLFTFAVSNLRKIVRFGTILPLFYTIEIMEAFVCLLNLDFIMKKSLLD